MLHQILTQFSDWQPVSVRLVLVQSEILEVQIYTSITANKMPSQDDPNRTKQDFSK